MIFIGVSDDRPDLLQPDRHLILDAPVNTLCGTFVRCQVESAFG
jgi:hypothetical protein